MNEKTNSNSDANNMMDHSWMKLAIEQAKKGMPNPNPHVGAVIVKHGKLLSQGHHAKAGEAHAEVVAIKHAGSEAKGSTLYVTFEPCNHIGRTGPCTEAIIQAGVHKVVIGCSDPLPHVPGAIKRLQHAGIEVEVGVCQVECEQLVQDFVKHFSKGIPWITLKAALTLDGRIATRTGDSKWITHELARKQAHQLRATHDAILVGVGTVLADNPTLNVRHVEGRNPIRVILDTKLRTPKHSNVLAHLSESPTWIFHGPEVSAKKKQEFESLGIELIECTIDENSESLDVDQVLQILAKRNIMRLLIEGGAKVNGSFLEKKHVDDAVFFISNTVFGDSKAMPFAFGPTIESMQDAFEIQHPIWKVLGEQIMVQGKLMQKKSPKNNA